MPCRGGHGRPGRMVRPWRNAGLLSGLLSICLALLAVGWAAGSYLAAVRRQSLREDAERALSDRASRLYELRLTRLPADGVHGAGEADGELAELLRPLGPVAFRLTVESLEAGLKSLRLSAYWPGGSDDVVLFRPLNTIAEDESASMVALDGEENFAAGVDSGRGGLPDKEDGR